MVTPNHLPPSLQQMTIQFQGWSMCRLATNPDSYSEPLGVSGSTFALRSEVEQGAILDRSLRFHPPASWQRKPGPDVGVFVSHVSLDGIALPHHNLLHGKVDLLPEPSTADHAPSTDPPREGEATPTRSKWRSPTAVAKQQSWPKFEGRNNLLSKDVGKECIDPFNLSIESPSGHIRLRRKAMWDPEDPSVGIHDASPQALQARGGQGFYPNKTFSDYVLCLSGLDPIDHRSTRAITQEYCDTRLRQLKEALERAQEDGDEQRCADLQRRLAVFQRQGRWQELKHQYLRSSVRYFFELNEPPDSYDLHHRYPRQKMGLPFYIANKEARWFVHFWLGCWDPDALCMYVQGALCLVPPKDSP